ncbi:hypothetical protein IAR55_000301 [Kwoniella newhampshirensis]|uniref:General transcription factor 3C polypeptide 5 (Transcription factor C subunit 1) n=1 Tax=Kwoniella newhampshirensis TaxID=1651941 RepID=A0AAW0Z690_9TREE
MMADAFPYPEDTPILEEAEEEINFPQASSSSTALIAPYRYLPKHAYASIEYPGPVSHPTSILKVVNQSDIDECFNGPSGSNPVLEIRYRGDQPGGPVRGHRASSQKLLLKVVRRRRKGKGREKEGEEGVFTAEVVGSVAQTVRFRSMADWHWAPNPEGETATLLRSLKELDYNAILDYSFPPINETFLEENPDSTDPEIRYRSLLDFQPTPLFTTRNLPYLYNFKMPNQAVEEEVYDRRTGQLRRRYVNRGRVAGVGPISVPHDQALGDVPKEPTNIIKNRMEDLDSQLIQRLRDLFDERPVWMRHSLLGQLAEEDRREVLRIKSYIPSVAYIMGTGPFWKCLVKFGYDPRIDSESRRYQRIFFYPNKRTIRNPLNVDPAEEDDDDKAKGWWMAEQERRVENKERPPVVPKKAHVFDGQYLHRERGDYQLCDVTDPLIAKYINEPSRLLSVCSPISGWYPPSLFTLIKTLVRIKYMYMWETSQPAPDDLCYGAIEDYERGMLVPDDGDEEEVEPDDAEEEDDDGDREAEGSVSPMRRDRRVRIREPGDE